MNKSLPIIIGVILIVLVGGLVFWQGADTSAPAQTATSTDTGMNATSTSPDSSATTAKTYTMAEVSTHKSDSSCWTVIDGSVYDLTTWIPQHPGGQRAIEGICGKDGTAAFHGQHDDAPRQASILATFKIGTLAQ